MRVDNLSIKLVSLNKTTITKKREKEGEEENGEKNILRLTAATLLTYCITFILILLSLPSRTSY